VTTLLTLAYFIDRACCLAGISDLQLLSLIHVGCHIKQQVNMQYQAKHCGTVRPAQNLQRLLPAVLLSPKGHLLFASEQLTTHTCIILMLTGATKFYLCMSCMCFYKQKIKLHASCFQCLLSVQCDACLSASFRTYIRRMQVSVSAHEALPLVVNNLTPMPVHHFVFLDKG